MKSLRFFTLTALSASILLLSGCGGGGDNTASVTEKGGNSDTTSATENNKKIVGDITGNGYANNSIFHKFLNKIITPAYALGLTSPDKIVVMYNGGRDKKEFNINPDGSFEIDTSILKANDLVIFVVNSATKKIFGHLNLKVNSDTALDFIDKSKLQGTLDLGSIDSENGCKTEITLSSSNAFSDKDIKNLSKVAISDNALILYKNIYLNPNFYSEIQALFKMEDLNDIKDRYSNIDNFGKSNLIGLRPVIETDLDSFNSISKDDIILYPPANVNFTTQRDGNFNQKADSSNPIPSTYKDSDSNFYEFGFVESFPEGDWLLKIKGSSDIKGKFSYSASYPYNSAGKPIIPIPQIRLNMDSNDNTKIKSIDVKWYIYNGTTYEEASEDFMNSIASQDNDSDDGFIAPLRSSYGDDIAIFKSKTWNGRYTLENGSSVTLPANSRRVNMSYSIGQVSYQFLFE